MQYFTFFKPASPYLAQFPFKDIYPPAYPNVKKYSTVYSKFLLCYLM